MLLSWRASAPPNSKHSAAIGYCIYRSTKRKDPFPEVVNSVPFVGTSCADDLVEGGAKYYYVVRAISGYKVTSPSSNEAPAAIPSNQPPNTSLSSGTVPLCREQSPVK